MSKIKVYKFKVWDQKEGENRIAPRMGTPQFIKMSGGTIIDGTETEIDASMVDGNGQANISVQPTRLG